MSWRPRDESQEHVQCGFVRWRDDSSPKQDGVGTNHVTQNNAQFKMYELLISVILHLIFLDHS